MNASLFEIALSGLILAVWVYLAVARGRFWLMRERDSGRPAAVADAPAVVAIIPARDEADCIAQSITSLLAQNYPGSFSVVLVDDQSSDGTADRAIAAAWTAGAGERLVVLRGDPLPAGWAGKVWAQHQGMQHVQAQATPPRYVFFTDADTVHAPDTVTWLVDHAEKNDFVLVSLTAKWRCESIAERFLIPAFIFFFAMIYPFRWVNDRSRSTAAAAGGCMLVRFDALRAMGEVAAIRRDLIDDCALARALKPVGPIWLGLTERVHSLRAYPGFADFGRMVSRSAYAQLNYSPIALLATVVTMAVVFVLPIVFVLGAEGLPQWLGGAAWFLMAILYRPILQFYDRPPMHGFLLPAIALAYILFTIASALQYARGQGGLWKGRAQANLVEQ
jgi:hopene-associated glycosyltransferase HpnB